jgi:AcrR family transcriptional regulator
MRAEGYGAVTSRRVAEEAGIRQGLVYYYYETMDEVLLACFQRRTAQALERYQSEVRSARPVHAIWDDLSNKVDARLVFEFVALANHHDGIREEVNRFLVLARRLEAETIRKEAEARGVDLAPATPSAIAFLMYAATLLMASEATTGVTEGHDDVRALFEGMLKRFE